MSVEKLVAWFPSCDDCEKSITQGYCDWEEMLKELESFGWKVKLNSKGKIKSILCEECKK